jgi:hypothetical protein
MSNDINLSDTISIYKEYRDYLKHEEALINYRITWLIAINALLMATLGVVLQKRLEQLANVNTDVRAILATVAILLLICMLGLVVSAALPFMIVVGRNAIRNLEMQWDKRLIEYRLAYKLPSLARGEPSKNWLIDHLFTLWPFIFVLLWAVVFSDLHHLAAGQSRH